MSSKAKRQHTLPDRRLARAFNFSAADLAANRAGYMSRTQEWNLPLWMQRAFVWAGNRLPLSKLSPARRQTVERCCGAAQIVHEIRKVHGSRTVEVYIVYSLRLSGYGLQFRLSLPQVHLLVEGSPYRVYYRRTALGQNRILSLERAINGCKQ